MTSLTEKLLKIPKTHKYKMQPCFFYVSMKSWGEGQRGGNFTIEGGGGGRNWWGGGVVLRGGGQRGPSPPYTPPRFFKSSQKVPPPRPWDFSPKGAPGPPPRGGR